MELELDWHLVFRLLSLLAGFLGSRLPPHRLSASCNWNRPTKKLSRPFLKKERTETHNKNNGTNHRGTLEDDPRIELKFVKPYIINHRSDANISFLLFICFCQKKKGKKTKRQEIFGPWVIGVTFWSAKNQHYHHKIRFEFSQLISIKFIIKRIKIFLRKTHRCKPLYFKSDNDCRDHEITSHFEKNFHLSTNFSTF